MMITLIALSVFITSVLLAYALLRPRPNEIAERLQSYSYGTSRREVNELDKPFSERVLWPIVVRMAKFLNKASPQQMHDEVAKELESAGNPMSPTAFSAIKLLSMIGLPLLVGLPLLISRQPLSPLQMGVIVILFLFGMRLPTTWLRLKISARQGTIERSLPDALDLITVCMEAGLAFDASLAKVVEKTKGPLSDEFGRVLQEMNLGKLRRDALRDLGKRTGVPDLQSFVAAMVQADQMGIAIADILRIQSAELRIRRRQRAEEKAQKAPVKMVFPLVFCIFPSMMLVIIGPAAYSIYVNVIMRMQGE